MIGFVGAMASSLAVLVVFLTIILVQSINIVLDSREAIIKYNSENKLETEKLTVLIDQTKSFVISGAEVRGLAKAQESNPKANFALYCTYGYNLSHEVSEKIEIFNYIRLQQAGVNINLFPLKEQINKVNNCVIKDVEQALLDYPADIRKNIVYQLPEEQAVNRAKRESVIYIPQTKN